MTGTLTPEGAIKNAILAWDGTDWRKQPLIFGYSDRYAEAENNNAHAAGNFTLTFTAVPAGEIWTLQMLTARNISTNTSIEMTVTGGGVGHLMNRFITPGANTLVVATAVPLVLKEADVLSVLFETTLLNDWVQAWAWGYKMSIVE